jgi:hypothetical protein
MIVKKPIGAIKVAGTVARLTIGQAVPKNVLDFWKKTKQLDALLKAGAIAEDSKKETVINIEDKNKGNFEKK